MALLVRNQGGQLQVEMDLGVCSQCFQGEARGRGGGFGLIMGGVRFQVSWHFPSGQANYKATTMLANITPL